MQQVIGDRNIVIGLTGPDKADLRYPTEAELLQAFETAQRLPVEPYKETLSNEPLVPNLPTPGKIIETQQGDRFDATVMTLSNGVKVVLSLIHI